MLLGIVSDTHGHVEYTRPAIRMLESQAVDQVIHCGDIGSVEIVAMFAAWPTHFVFGNVDYPEQPLRAAIEAAGKTCHERFGSLEMDGRRIAFLHGDDWQLMKQTVQRGGYDLVCHGHTHVPRLEKADATMVLNPGALFRAEQHTIATVRLPELEIVHLTV